MKKAPEDLQKHTLHLYAGDAEKLREMYADAKLSVAEVIRQLVRTHINRVIKPVDTKKIKSEETL